MDPSWPYGMEHTGSGLESHQQWQNLPHHGLGIQAIRADELEERIFQHPDVLTHYSAVELYLRMDNATLQSIYHLRENTQYGKELAKLHASFFDSPPTDLFKLIYNLRLFKNYSATETLDRFEASRRERRDQQDSHRKTAPKLRTAPKGLTYRCPSEKCRKTFQKSGHARNHVENQHAEYLKLYPGWEPQQDLVSRSQSPVSDRNPLLEDVVDRERSRHQRHSMESPELNRPRRADVSVEPSETSRLDCISPRSLVFSSSSGDGDGASRRNSRVSPLLPLTPLAVDCTSMPSYYPQQISPTLRKRGRSPGLMVDPSLYPGEYDSYSVPRHSVPTRHDPNLMARRQSQKIRR